MSNVLFTYLKKFVSGVFVNIIVYFCVEVAIFTRKHLI